jgi:hypothetical protein
MAQDRNKDRRTLSALAALLPAGTLGLSMTLAAADAKAVATADPESRKPGSVAQRLQAIRESVSGSLPAAPSAEDPRFLKVDPDQRMAWWGNGWRGWGWPNWHNWGNGWHNWGNGGWGNWHNGWHNW